MCWLQTTGKTYLAMLKHLVYIIWLQICKLCSMCLSKEESFMLKTAFLEHLNRRNFIRIIPPPPAHSQYTPQHNQSTANYLMAQWFDRKCLQNPSWCS